MQCDLNIRAIYGYIVILYYKSRIPMDVYSGTRIQYSETTDILSFNAPFIKNRLTFSITCSHDLEDTRRPLMPHRVGAPTWQRTVVHVRHGRVVETGHDARRRVTMRRHFRQVSRVVERPVERHDRGISVDFATQSDGFLFQSAE